MGIFNKFFGKPKQEESNRNHSAVSLHFPPATTLDELLEQFGGLGLEKQMDVPAVLGERSWQFNMQTGSITFGEDMVFPVQILGTFSHSSQTWLWAWANEKSGIPEHLVEQSLQLKRYGETNQIAPLIAAQFEGAINDVHKLGMIASGMFGASCYYIADYGQGAMLVTLKGKQFDEVDKIEHHRILTTFSQLISLFELNYKPALKYYLMGKEYQVSEAQTSLTGTKGINNISAEFDSLGRLANLKG